MDANYFRTRLVQAVQAYPCSAHLSYRRQVGFEVEGHLLKRKDPLLRTIDAAPDILARKFDPDLVAELGAFNFEFNGQPVRFAGNCLTLRDEETRAQFHRLKHHAADFGAVPLYVAIPPTLTAADLAPGRLKKGPRIRLLEESWSAAHAAVRQETGMPLSIGNFVPTSVQTFASMCSCQYHLELPVNPAEAGFQLNLHRFLTPIALAASVGSPVFLDSVGGYMEHRIPIWEVLGDAGRGRVHWGKDWVDTPYDELMFCAKDIPFWAMGDDYEAMSDWELFIQHLKTCWTHVRLVPALGHWRVENRVFPSVHPEDSKITAAWYFGLVLGAARRSEFHGLRKVPFAAVYQSFQAAVRFGLDADIVWLDGEMHRAVDLALRLLDVAREGLLEAGIDDADGLVDAMRDRILGRATPAEKLLGLMRKHATAGRSDAEVRAAVTRDLLTEQDDWMK